jgi:hypothetical protein
MELVQNAHAYLSLQKKLRDQEAGYEELSLAQAAENERYQQEIARVKHELRTTQTEMSTLRGNETDNKKQIAEVCI